MEVTEIEQLVLSVECCSQFMDSAFCGWAEAFDLQGHQKDSFLSLTAILIVSSRIDYNNTPSWLSLANYF